jgi:uncharacterized protein (DUF1800 family)
MTERQLIAHLLRRAGFGATPAELDFHTSLGFDAAVDRLVNYDQVDNSALDARLTAANYDLTRMSGIQQWWLLRVLHTARPLEEKLTLFWHDHWACNNDKVGNVPYMLNQNWLFRENAMGSFPDMVLKVSQDPAMLVFLDGRDNVRRRPNENFARELMELFTLGIGNYTERDIQEAARALTGWTVRDDRFFNNVTQHDNGTKTVFGQTGAWWGEDICRIVVQHPACAPFIARKLIRWFVTDSPSAEYITRMAEVFEASGLNVRALVAAIFRSPEFRDPANVRGLVKSPAEFMIGLMKGLDIQALPTDFPSVLRQLQQELFNPPGVDGWNGGPGWLSTTTFLYRTNFINRLCTGNDAARVPFINPVTTVTQNALTTNQLIADYYIDRLLDADMSAAGRQVLVEWLNGTTTRNRTRRLRGLVHLVLCASTYQLN